MADVVDLQYVGGPFDRGVCADDFIDRIELRSPAGNGFYVLGRDEVSGVRVYRWEAE